MNDGTNRARPRLASPEYEGGQGASLPDHLPRVTSVARAEEARRFEQRIAKADVVSTAEVFIVAWQRDGEISQILLMLLSKAVENLRATREPDSIASAVKAAVEAP